MFALARDLHDDFYEYFWEFFDTMIVLVDQNLNSIELLDAVFSCLAYSIKLLWRNLIADLERCFMYFKLLISKVKGGEGREREGTWIVGFMNRDFEVVFINFYVLNRNLWSLMLKNLCFYVEICLNAGKDSKFLENVDKGVREGGEDSKRGAPLHCLRILNEFYRNFYFKGNSILSFNTKSSL